MYQTVLKKITGTMAVGANGEKLEFIGNWPSQVGDTVWTDGKVIFGHIPVRSSSPVMFDPAGIPVACEKLKGYFTPTGTWKGYNVAAEAWIVNSAKNFYSGPEEYNGAKVIDALIADNGDVYIVTDGLCRKNKAVTYDSYAVYYLSDHWSSVGGLRFVPGNIFAQGYGVIILSKPLPQTVGVTLESINKKVNIFRNDQLILAIDLEEYAKLAVAKCEEKFGEIMEKSITPSGNDWPYELLLPPENFVASAYAYIQTFQMSQNGEWDALIFTSAYGYCFPYVYKYGDFTTLSHSLSYRQDGSISGNTWNSAGLRWGKQSYLQWQRMTCHVAKLLYVHNGKIVNEVVNKAKGGHLVYIHPFQNLGTWMTTNGYGPFEKWYKADFRATDELKEEEIYFPLQAGYTVKLNGDEMKGIYNSEKELIFDFSPLDINKDKISIEYLGEKWYPAPPESKEDYVEIEGRAFGYGYPYDDSMRKDRYDSNVQTQYIFYRASTKETKEAIAQTVTYENGILLSKTKTIIPEEYEMLDGYYDANSADGLYRFNPCFLKLKGDKYLLGVHGGKLYIKTNSGIQEVGDGLKNFRLTQLNNIAKAKAKGSNK